MLIATGVMTCASMAPAMAGNPAPDDANKGWTLSQLNKAVAGVAKTEDVAVVYDKNKTSLRSTNAGVAENAIALGKGAYAVKNSIAIGNGAYTQDGTWTKGHSVALGNGAVTGAKSTSIGSNAIGGREGTITIGANANNGSLYATIIGTDSKVNYMTRNSGAAATIVGAKSEIKNDNKSFSGVANGIFGSANTIENSNGVTIQGSGNTVTNAYKNMSGWDFNLGGIYVKKDAGAVGVIGGMNTVSNQIYTNVIGFGNTVAGDADNISHDVFVAGSRNNLSKVSDSIVMGNDNEISDRSNVISLGHENSIKANNAVAIGNGASVSAEGGVALGVGSVADRVAGEVGYDPTTGKAYDIENGDAPDYVWKATSGAVSVGSGRETRQIINVAAGTEDTDAVNVAQLKKVNEEALKHSTVTNGDNITVTEGLNKDGGKEYNVALNNDIHLFGDNGAMVNISGSHGTIWTSGSVTAGSVVAGDVVMDSTTATVSGLGNKTTAYEGFATTGKAATEEQLKEVATEAGKHSKVVNGNNTNVEETTVDGQKVYKVNLNNNIMVGDVAGKYVSISGTNGTIEATGAIATKDRVYADKGGKLADIDVTGNTISNGDAKLALNGAAGTAGIINGQGASVYMQGSTTVINSKVSVDKDGKISGVAAGTADTDAVNVSQLQKAAAASATTVSDGVNTTVTATKAEDGHTDYKVNLNKDLVGIESISNGDAKLTLGGIATELANGQGASVKLFGDTTTINNAVTVYKDGRISGVADGINNNDAVNVGQLNKVSEIANKGWNLATNGVATEATNVKPGDYVDFSGDKNISVSHDGTKVKVELNKDLDVNSVQTNALNSKYNLSVGTMAENGIMPFFVNSTGAFYAAHNKFSVDKDGNMNANSVQTNALNSKYNLSVGTANANGTVPFFVNSNGAFYAANNNFSVDKDGKVIATAGEIGNVVLNNGVYTGHSALRDGELFVGDASGNYSQITTKGAKLGKVTIAEDGKISGVAAGEVSSTSTDAINGSQLHQTNENVAALDKRVTQNEADIATNKANIAQNAADIAANKANIAQNAADIATNKANIAQNAADIAQNKADIAQNKADIAQNKADIAQNKTDIKNLDNRVTNVEELAKKHTTVTAGDNITVAEDTNKDGGKEYKVALDKDIKLDSVTTGQTVMNNDGLKVGDKVSVTATAVTAGKTSISDEGVKVGDKTYISADGLNANDQKVTNVKAGDISETSKDAVNGSQLYKTNQEVVNNTNRINQLGSRVNKVGAGAAALAALHPMDFDPDDKLTFSAGYGNYAGENAAAIGAYYRPDEKVMFSVAGTVGNGENMVNAGVSFALDRTNHVSNSRTALAREVIDLRGQLAVMGAKMAKMEKAFGMLDETKTKLFPDVPANHWAYEYIAKLAGNGYIEGYPDGNFGGDRLMTRYEFAAMLYRAIENGAALEEKIIKEFEPELGRIRVDRISGEDGDRDKIERVRVNDTKGERDHYGNKLAK